MGKTKRGLWRPVALILVIVCVTVLARALGAGEQLGRLRDWIHGFGALAPLVFAVIYAASVVAAFPGSVLSVAAGALFGSLLGVAVVSVASTVGAALAFLVARYFARAPVEQWLTGNERFRRLDRMTAKHGDIVVAVTRLVPLFPFNLLNYGFGLTSVPFRTYVLWSWLCMLPGTILYVVGADAVARGVEEGRVPWELAAILAVMAVILVFLVRKARKRIGDEKRGEGAGDE